MCRASLLGLWAKLTSSAFSSCFVIVCEYCDTKLSKSSSFAALCFFTSSLVRPLDISDGLLLKRLVLPRTARTNFFFSLLKLTELSFAYFKASFFGSFTSCLRRCLRRAGFWSSFSKGWPRSTSAPNREFDFESTTITCLANPASIRESETEQKLLCKRSWRLSFCEAEISESALFPG